MKSSNMSLNPNRIAAYLNKPPEQFSKKDLIKFIADNGIRMINFRYIGGDGK